MIQLDLYGENTDRRFGEASGYVPVPVRVGGRVRMALFTLHAIDEALARDQPEDTPTLWQYRRDVLLRWFERNDGPLAFIVIAWAIGLMLLLSACSARPVNADPAPPVAAGCSSLCETPCIAATGDTGIRWDGSPVDASAWDALAERTTLALAEKLRQCETHRRACAVCLDNLRARKVIQ